jgi:hypothetical protein
MVAMERRRSFVWGIREIFAGPASRVVAATSPEVELSLLFGEVTGEASPGYFHQLVGVEGVDSDLAITNGCVEPWFGGMKGGSRPEVGLGIYRANSPRVSPLSGSQSLTGSSQVRLNAFEEMANSRALDAEQVLSRSTATFWTPSARREPS